MKEKRKGGGKRGRYRERERKKEHDRHLYSLPWHVYIICCWHLFGPEATVRRMMQPQILQHQGCSQRIFAAYMEAGQTSALARHLAYSTLNCPSPVLKSSGLWATAMFAIVFQFSFRGREQSNWAKTNWRIFYHKIEIIYKTLLNSLLSQSKYPIWLNYNYRLHFIGRLFCNCKNKASLHRCIFILFMKNFKCIKSITV